MQEQHMRRIEQSVLATLTAIGCLLLFVGFPSNSWMVATVYGTKVHSGLFKKCQTALNGKETCTGWEEHTGQVPDKIRLMQTLATISGILVLFTAVIAVICLFNLKYRCADDKCRRVLHIILDMLLLITVTSAILSSVIFFGLYREFYDDTKVGWSAITFNCGWCVIFLAQLPRLRYYHLPEPANILLARRIVLIIQV